MSARGVGSRTAARAKRRPMMSKPVEHAPEHFNIADNIEMEDTFERYSDRLHHIFSYYCSYGEPLNATQLKSIKWMKMMKDVGIVGGKWKGNKENASGNAVHMVSQVDADLIFTKLLGTAKKGRMDFEQFLRSIAMLAEKIYPIDPKEAFTRIVEERLLELESRVCEERSSGQHHINQLMEILKDEKMVEMLGVVHKSLLPHYSYYANHKGLMEFDGFSKFCADFGIFPDIIPKAKIMRFFYTLANFF